MLITHFRHLKTIKILVIWNFLNNDTIFSF